MDRVRLPLFLLRIGVFIVMLMWTLDKVDALAHWRESDIFDERERVALEYAEAVTMTGVSVNDDLMARLSKHFDEDGIVELTALVAFQNLSSKFNSALDVPAQGFCKLPDRE